MEIELEKGYQSLTIQVPEEKISDVLLGKDVSGMSSFLVKKHISESIGRHAPPDVSTKKIAVLIPDDTRLWARGDLYVPEIVKALFELGVPKDKIKIVIALGTHADMAKEKFAKLAGDFSVEHLSIINSANRNQERLVYLGETSRKTELYFTREAVDADHIIIFGGVLHHMTAGYGGGRKYIFPGIAGYDSIQKNHSLAMTAAGSPHPLVRQAQLEGNPVSEDIQEAVDIFLQGKTCTYVAVAANGQGDIFNVDVGPLTTTFSKSCKKIDEVCCVKVPQKEDFALISAGGHRADGQLYQATKALFNAINGVKDGGQILFVAGCAEGAGNVTFGTALKEFRNDPMRLGQQLVEVFDMPSYIAFRLIDILSRYQVSLVSEFSQAETLELGFNFVDDFENYVNNLEGKGYVIPFAENILPIIEET